MSQSKHDIRKCPCENCANLRRGERAMLRRRAPARAPQAASFEAEIIAGVIIVLAVMGVCAWYTFPVFQRPHP